MILETDTSIDFTTCFTCVRKPSVFKEKNVGQDNVSVRWDFTSREKG